MSRLLSNKTILVSIISLLLFAVMLYLGLQAQRHLAPNVTLSALVSAPCDLHKTACSAQFANGASLSLSIDPKHIPSLQPLDIMVKTTGIITSDIDIEFIGTEMDMGLNRTRLKPIALDRFSGQAMIPTCIHTKMLWTARVLLHTEKGILMASFQFESIKSTH